MDWKKNVRRASALALSAALAVGIAPQLAGPQAASAAEVSEGFWQTLPTPTSVKLAARVDQALAAQDPKPKVKVTKGKRNKTITVAVTCKAKKAGIQNAKSKKARMYASMAMRVYSPSLYRDETCEACLSTKKTVHGVNNYGTDRSSDYSTYVGRDGTADIYVSYEGILCTYKNGTFRKANLERELYYTRTKRIKVTEVEVPEDYRVKLQLKKTR